jgi:hypothetical protein
MTELGMTHPIVFIGPQDYRRIRNIIGSSLPERYDVWLGSHAVRKRLLDRLGFIVREVQIEPDELIRYANIYAQAPTLQMLNLLAQDKANGWVW